MPNHQDRIQELNQKLEILLSKQEGFAKELMTLYKEIEALKQLRPEETSKTEVKKEHVQRVENKIRPIQQPTEKVTKEIEPKPIVVPQPLKQTSAPKIQKPKEKSNLEKFIGENLINKIGIAITVIGVAIGAKYSIENNLISPMTRIILGYLAGLGLLGLGFKLKSRYAHYSAVLVSGALAILYFITFAAYSFYGLFPQLMAFALMLIFTIFGVVAAFNYNKPIIAHIGLVGAYAVPFLLSDGSGNASILFGYMTIINIGILVISIKKYWKSLYFASFGFTWLIFSSWLALTYEATEQFTMALVFASLFFIIFYVTFLGYKLIKSEKFLKSDIILLLLNSFIFYGIGYGLLANSDNGKELLGAFTLVNAIVHFIVSTVLFKKKLADRNLFYLVSGMVLVFVTLAIPVQLNGNWVTLLWALEAALLFWIGRTKQISFYENLSYPLMILGFLSLTEDWSLGYGSTYGHETTLTPLLNSYFLTAILFLAAFSFINWINFKKKNSDNSSHNAISTVMSFVIPAILLFVVYASFYLEIEHYWKMLYQDSEVVLNGQNDYNNSQYNYGLKDFGNIWLFNYTLMFISVLAFVNIKKLKNRLLGLITLSLGLITSLLFLTVGLYLLSELRVDYLYREDHEYYEIGVFNIGIRYVSFAFYGLLLVAIRKLAQQVFMKINFKVPFEVLLHVSILWILSSELLNWMDLAGSDQSYKLGLSILWGLYALLLIGLGIWKQRKYLRIGAIVLFGATLLKLFFYDIASLNTISKTIVFVSLGVLLLIISFLYNKYKNVIDDESLEPKV